MITLESLLPLAISLPIRVCEMRKDRVKKKGYDIVYYGMRIRDGGEHGVLKDGVSTEY